MIRITDGTGATAATYAYDPYGAQTSAEPPSSTPNPWRYASGYYDTTTHYLKFGTRYYDPNLGRWTQRDPSGEESNAYAYVNNDPVNHADPSGRFYVELSLCGGYGIGGCVIVTYDFDTGSFGFGLGFGVGIGADLSVSFGGGDPGGGSLSFGACAEGVGFTVGISGDQFSVSAGVCGGLGVFVIAGYIYDVN